MSKFTENCSADKMSHSWPSIYYHIFGIIDMVSSRNRVEGQDIRKYCSKHHFFSSGCPPCPSKLIFLNILILTVLSHKK